MQPPAQQAAFNRHFLRRPTSVLPGASLPFHAEDVKPKWEETGIESRQAKRCLRFEPLQRLPRLLDGCLPLPTKVERQRQTHPSHDVTRIASHRPTEVARGSLRH